MIRSPFLHGTLALIVWCAVLPAVQAKDKQAKIPVFVFAGGAQGTAFTDPNQGRVESANDIKKALKSCNAVRPVDTREQAIIVLEVLERMANEGVRVKLTAGALTTTMEGMERSYVRSAREITYQLDKWTIENWKILDAMDLARIAAGGK